MWATAKGFLLLVEGVVIVATALPLLRASAWWVRIFDFPRLQIFLAGAAVLVLHLLCNRPFRRADAFFLVLLAVALAYQGWRIYPYTVLDHFPILAVLSFEPERQEGQERPEPADRSDEVEARKKIREGAEKGSQ